MRFIRCLIRPLFCLLIFSCHKPSNPTPSSAKALSFQKTWSKVAGGSSDDQFWQGAATTDGGYVAIGNTSSTDGDISGLRGATDALVVRYDAAGNKLWQALIGGKDTDYGTSIQQLSDGGFIGVGYTKSNDGDITGNHGGSDAMLFKLSGSGTLIWVKTLGNADNEEAESLVVNPDGTYTLAGHRYKTALASTSFDAWVCKVDHNGNVIWEKIFGGSNNDLVFSITSSADGGYVFAGYSYSTDGDVTGVKGMSDLWLVKIDGSGNKLWQKTYGGSQQDWGYSVIKAATGYVIAGRTTSNDGEVLGNQGGFDAWVIKVDEKGEKQWQRTLGSSANDFAQGVVKSRDGGYLVGITAGGTPNGDFSKSLGWQDAWIVKLDDQGNKVGQQILGGGDQDLSFAIAEGRDGSFALLGASMSSDGDVSGWRGGWDGWILKFNDQQ